MYRYSNGRFKSKKRHELEQKRKKELLRGMLAMTLPLLTIGILLGFAVQPYTITVTQQLAEAHEYTPDLCGLDVVTCDGEVDERLQRMLDTIPHETEETANRIKYLYEYATEQGMDPEPIAKTIYCESMWYCIQSGVTKDGVQEKSYCLAQIHSPSHPEISTDELWDPYFNIRYITDHYYTDTWYGYDRELDICSNNLHEYWK